MDHLSFLDRIKRLVVIAMFSDDELMERLVLKGGNLLDIVYNLSARASVDVDLSIDGEYEDVDRLKAKISRALTATFAEIGHVVFDFTLQAVPRMLSDELKDFWGGYRIEFKLIEQSKYDQFFNDIPRLRRNAANIGKKDSTKFKVDISKHEFCTGKQRYTVDDYQVYGYSPEMFVCEKLRAICQQMAEYIAFVKSYPSARARDFIDIHTVAEHFGVDFGDFEFHKLVRSNFSIKRVPLVLITKVKETRDQHIDDFFAVKDTVRPEFDLKDFDFYFDYVCGKCELLEPLWRE